MLKKLIKYDLKKVFKFLIWFYAISIVLAGITRILKIWDNIEIVKIICSVFSSLTYSAVATVIINTFIHVLLRFSTSFYKDQSYLTHTLPIKKDTLVLSKYLSSLIIILSSVVVSFLSLFMVLYSPELIKGLKSALEGVIIGFNISSGVFVLLIVLILSSQICAMISLGFTAIVKGYSYNHKRGIKGFLWFVCYYAICLISTLALVVAITAITGDLKSLFSEKMSNVAFLTVLIVACITYVLYAVGFYFLCKREFKKGVNVD